jgi:hypothetical protein
VKNFISVDENRSVYFFLKVKISLPCKRMGTASVYIYIYIYISLEVLVTLVLSYRPQFVRTYVCYMNFMSQSDRNNERTEYHGLSLQDRVCLPFSFAYTLEIWCECYYRNNSLR